VQIIGEMLPRIGGDIIDSVRDVSLII
jgi:hypothetical protein